MAKALPDRVVEKPRQGRISAWLVTLPGVSVVRWLPPLLLALATVLALIAAYSVRPSVAIELGDYYDSAYLPNTRGREAGPPDFHAREVRLIGAQETTAWPAAQLALELPGHRQGIWQITVQAADGLPDGALKGTTLAVNDVRVGIARSGPRDFVAIVPAELAAADRLVLRLEPALVGDPAPPAGLVKEVRLGPARTFRWTSERSTISLPGLGRGDWNVTIAAIAQHPDGAPIDAIVEVNGVALARLPEGSLRRVSLLVPAALVPDGNLTIAISAKTFKDPRPLGVLLHAVHVAPAGPRSLVPPLSSLLYALTIALCLYACLLRMIGPVYATAVQKFRASFQGTEGTGPRYSHSDSHSGRRKFFSPHSFVRSLQFEGTAAGSEHLKPRLLAAGLALVVVLGGAWALAEARYPTTFMLPRLAALALWSVGLLMLLLWLLPWAFRKAGVPLSAWLLGALLLTFFVGYWIKAGGMLYPYFVGKDVSWHMDRVRTIANGQLAVFYGTNSPLNESTMPTAEWGSNRPIIPYSPWFHMFATSFLLLPMPLVLAAHMFSALVDSSRVFLIGLLARKSGCSERASLFAALLYAVTPATFVLHSWGNIPTTFGMWWTLLSTVFIVAAYRRLDRPWPFVALTLLLTATLLFYTVMAVFMMLFLGLLVPALWLTGRTANRRRPTTKDERGSGAAWSEMRPVLAIGLSALAALGLSTLIYYGQYIAPILERTVPYFLQAARPGDTNVGIQVRQPFLSYLADYWPRMGYFQRPNAYGLQLVVMLAIASLFGVRSCRLRALLLCWIAVAALFMVAGNRISMVDKQVFYLIPALALLVGSLLGRLWQRGLPARLVVLSYYAFTLVAALDMWLWRIAATRQ